ncbi:MAG: DUF3473 domain-containing protein [Pseudomonadota bacterium]
MRSRIRHYTGLRTMEKKLSWLLRDFRWDRMDRLFDLDVRLPVADSAPFSKEAIVA